MKDRQDFHTPSQLTIITGLTRFALKASFRNRASYFFSFVFPLVFVIIFGLLGNSKQTLKLGVTDDLTSANPIYATLDTIAKQNDAPVQLVYGTRSDLEQKVRQGDVSAIITSGNTETSVEVVGTNGNPSGRAAAESFVGGIANQLNLQVAHVTNPPFKVEGKEISGKSFRYIDFALPGQIGFSLLSIATFGIAFPLITLRKTLVLKRMFATTVRPISFVISQCLARSVQAMLQALVILGVGVVAFQFTLANGWISVLEMLVLSFLGILAFLGFGILIGNIARDEQSLPIAINLFNLPQILLAGVFFQIDGMPKWVQAIGNNLPLAYLNTAMRKVAIDGAHFTTVWPYVLGLVGWGIFAYVLAARVFKSE